MGFEIPRLEVNLNAMGAATRRFWGNVLAPALYCFYVLQLVAIINTEIARDLCALFFYFAIHSLRPIYCIRKVQAAQGRFQALQVDKVKRYLLASQDAAKSRFCHLAQRSNETAERIVSAGASGDWVHQVLGGLPLIETQNMQPDRRDPAPRTSTHDDRNEPFVSASGAAPVKDKFPRVFTLVKPVKPAASAPLPPRHKITKKAFQLARAAPGSGKSSDISPHNGSGRASGAKRSMVSLSDFRNPWADPIKPFSTPPAEAASAATQENVTTQENVSSESLVTAPSGTGMLQTSGSAGAGAGAGACPTSRPKAKTAPSGSSIRSKVLKFENSPLESPPAIPER